MRGSPLPKQETHWSYKSIKLQKNEFVDEREGHYTVREVTRRACMQSVRKIGKFRLAKLKSIILKRLRVFIHII